MVHVEATKEYLRGLFSSRGRGKAGAIIPVCLNYEELIKEIGVQSQNGRGYRPTAFFGQLNFDAAIWQAHYGSTFLDRVLMTSLNEHWQTIIQSGEFQARGAVGLYQVQEFHNQLFDDLIIGVDSTYRDAGTLLFPANGTGGSLVGVKFNKPLLSFIGYKIQVSN